jgi:hypothetical protein
MADRAFMLNLFKSKKFSGIMINLTPAEAALLHQSALAAFEIADREVCKAKYSPMEIVSRPMEQWPQPYLRFCYCKRCR